ncbi:hypothetical protein [Chryseobacterium cheonjiense]|uniref:YD repeat-containing protein n=1 Tax=Chryseobacterium cheonjiense TaxID=2728845 RepID=A0A7Y0FKF8_9FLAO|nr:hypothetical protein [Chryseobacterium cheonjiense]NML59411.1 hypothetical protein [Chryseobacterium cheonjiense]
MKKKIYSILVLSALLSSSNVFGQINYEVPKFPKTPESSNFTKYIDIPVSKYTGVPSIEIPLITIEESGQSFPIILKYHSSGIKVDEIASRVGLGWYLDIGGAKMSKQVYGYPDSAPTNTLPLNFNINTGNICCTADEYKALWALGYSGPNLLTPKDTAPIDLMPDIYDYSVNGKSGKFILDQDKILMLPKEDVKVSIGNEPLLKDNNGNLYEFIGTNTITSNSGYNNIGDVFSLQGGNQWQTRKITLINNSSVDFLYDKTVNYQQLLPTSNKETFPFPTDNSYFPPDIEIDNPYTYFLQGNTEKLITEIKYSAGKVVFEYSLNEREDLPGDFSLKRIVSYDKTNRIIQDYSFIYSYFNSNEDVDALPVSNTALKNSLTKRLKLTEIKNNVHSTSHNFEYYESAQLPHRLSNSIDYWGLYNGQNNPHKIPALIYNNRYYEGANREVNENYAITGLLKKVIYPTKGYSEYKYELDDYYFNNTENSYSKKLKTSLHIENESYSEILFTTPNNTFSYSLMFNSSHNMYNGNTNSIPENGTFCKLEVLENNVLLKSVNIDNIYSLSLDPNKNYKFKLKNEGVLPNKCKAELYGIEITPNFVKNKKVGSFRIKQIDFFDGTSAMKRTYSYNLSTDASSGNNLEEERIYTGISEAPKDLNGNTRKTLIFSSDSFNHALPKAVGYSFVTENFENGISSYKKEFIFTNSYKDENRNQDIDLNVPYNYKDYKNGLPVKESSYNSNGTKLIDKEFYYGFDNYFNQFSYSPFTNGNQNDDVYWAIALKPYSVEQTPISGLGYKVHFKYANYPISSSWVKPTKTKITKYFNGTAMEEITDYYYDNSYKHLNPITQTSTSPDGSITENTYQYAHEKNNQKLINANMIGIPLETAVIKKQNASDQGKTISRTETKYDNAANLFPTSVISYDLQSTASTEVTYDQYDSKGNLQQYTAKDGISTVIIWGYNQTQPIAKIIGAKLSDIQQSLISSIVNVSDLDASNPLNEPALITALDDFRKNSNMANYQVTTYTYDPLIGVTSITPPSGIREVYIYDFANRLMEIREGSQTGKLLKEFKYNYKN